MRPVVLIVDDELRLAEVLALALEARDIEAFAVNSVVAAEDFVRANAVDVVLTDLRMPELGGRELLHRLRVNRPDLPIIIMTAYASVRDAVDLVKDGAFDYVSKPFEVDDVVATINRALRLGETLDENRRLRREIEQKFHFDNLIGDSPAFQQVLRQITEVCSSRATVLIQGESGTGKELVARAIHYNSPRRAKPFIPVNCAAIPENLLESELFGHARGAFTGAVAARSGRFAAADGGTIFLDEVGDMPLSIQPKVLRALQEQTFEAVGSDRATRVDARIIVATHKDLRRMVDDRSFREDLYYRLNVFAMTLPALRERIEDVPAIAMHFLRQFADEMGKKVVSFSPAAETAMRAYSWPGNIRELQNSVERAVIVARGTAVDLPDLPRYVLESASSASAGSRLPDDLDAELAKAERNYIIEALKESQGVQVKAAARLGITERSLWHRLKKHGIRIDKNIG
ncbi:sigma-54 dependent transcriptional regulator [Terrarubrum flagellatum]|uniref:sigma-54-dependent transcriptional regulator n=1 Tax=Terrirubrum flagellatum TaxID=2895980 RepID=UPI00314515BA